MWQQIKLPIVGILICAALLLGFELIPTEYKQGPLVRMNQLRAKAPNIMLITIDSLRADHVHLSDSVTSTSSTPFLSSFMKKGVVFERAIAPAYLTFQTDASIFSGLYPSQHGMWTWVTPIRDNLTLLQNALATQNYESHAFVSPSLYKYFRLFDGFTTYSMAPKAKSLLHNKELILSHLASATSTEPFFIFWHVYDVHLPYYPTAHENYSGPFSDVQYRFQWEKQSTSSVALYRPTTDRVDITPADVAYLRKAYTEGVRYTDGELEKFFTVFKEQHPEVYANTVFIITAEHGEDLEEHGFVFHRDLYDVNTHVPLAIVNTRLLAPQRYSETVSLLDVYPTILDIAGVGSTKTKEAESLLPRIQDPKIRSAEQLIFAERQPYDEVAVWKGNWKFILRNPDMPAYEPSDIRALKQHIGADDFFINIRKYDITFTDELYDLSVDAYEQQNMAGTGLPIETELREAAEAFRERMRGERSMYVHEVSADPAIPLSYP